MDGVTLGRLLRRATPYERWRAPLDRRLGQAAVLSGASIVIVLLVPTALWSLTPFEPPGAFWALAAVDVVGAAAFARLLAATDGLPTGTPRWHRVAFGLVLVGAPNGFILSVALAWALLVLTFWAIGAIWALAGESTLLAHLLPAALALLVVVATITLVIAIAALSTRGRRTGARRESRGPGPALPALPSGRR